MLPQLIFRSNYSEECRDYTTRAIALSGNAGKMVIGSPKPVNGRHSKGFSIYSTPDADEITYGLVWSVLHRIEQLKTQKYMIDFYQRMLNDAFMELWIHSPVIATKCLDKV